MKKVLALTLRVTLRVTLCVFLLTALCGCADAPARPETNLEFWIAENVDGTDFSGYRQRYGIMGGREYYGSGYVPTVDGNGEQRDPEHCVIYTVTSYPDYSSGRQHVTRITITDPAVSVYGICVDSSAAEVAAAMERGGFRLREGEGGVTYVKGRFSVRFSEGCIVIAAEVSNRLGIQF